MKENAGGTPPSTARPVVLVAERRALLRESIRQVVATFMRRAVLVDVHDGAALLDAAQRHPCARLAFVNLSMPRLGDGDRLSEMARLSGNIPIVALSNAGTRELARRTMRIASVHAFVPHDATEAQLRSATAAAIDGRKLPVADLRDDMRTPGSLTPRQQEVRSLLHQGLGNQAIARVLSISDEVARNLIGEMLRTMSPRSVRLGLDTQAE